MLDKHPELAFAKLFKKFYETIEIQIMNSYNSMPTTDHFSANRMTIACLVQKLCQLKVRTNYKSRNANAIIGHVKKIFSPKRERTPSWIFYQYKTHVC